MSVLSGKFSLSYYGYFYIDGQWRYFYASGLIPRENRTSHRKGLSRGSSATE